MAESINGIKFQQAESLLKIDRQFNEGYSDEEASLFDIDKDGKLDVAEQAALFSYKDNQEKIKFDFDKDGKLDKAEQAAYEAYIVQRADERREELINNLASIIARNEDGSLAINTARKLSNENLEEIIQSSDAIDEPLTSIEERAFRSARVLLNYNRANNMNTNEFKSTMTPDEKFIEDPANFKLEEPKAKLTPDKIFIENPSTFVLND